MTRNDTTTHDRSAVMFDTTTMDCARCPSTQDFFTVPNETVHPCTITVPTITTVCIPNTVPLQQTSKSSLA